MMLALRLQFCGHNLPMLNARHVLFNFQLAPKNNRHRAGNPKDKISRIPGSQHASKTR